MLTKKPKVSDLTKRDVFQLNLSQNNETIGTKCCRAEFSSVWYTLTAEEFSENGHFRHLINHFFRSQ